MGCGIWGKWAERWYASRRRRLECKGGAHCGRAKRERLEVIPRENVTADEECARPRDEEREEGDGGEEERAGGEVVDVEERGEEKQQVEVCIGAR